MEGEITTAVFGIGDFSFISFSCLGLLEQITDWQEKSLQIYVSVTWPGRHMGVSHKETPMEFSCGPVGWGSGIATAAARVTAVLFDPWPRNFPWRRYRKRKKEKEKRVERWLPRAWGWGKLGEVGKKVHKNNHNPNRRYMNKSQCEVPSAGSGRQLFFPVLPVKRNDSAITGKFKNDVCSRTQ